MFDESFRAESVPLSSDGDTALVGGSGDNGGIGAAWVFTRSGSTWTQQGAKLTGSGEIGKGLFGEGVALFAAVAHPSTGPSHSQIPHAVR